MNHLKKIDDDANMAKIETVRDVLEECDWNVSHAAKLLGCSRSAVLRIIDRSKDLSKDVRKHGPGRGRPSF